MTVLFLALVAAGLNPRPIVLMLERAAAQILQRSRPEDHGHGHGAAAEHPRIPLFSFPPDPCGFPEKKGMPRC